MPQEKLPSSKPVDPIGLVPKIISALMCLVVSGLGMIQILTEHAFSSTSKYGGSSTSLEGRPAMVFGAGMVCLGVAMLFFHCKTAGAAGWWLSVWLVAGVSLMLYAGIAMR